jgi:Putative peptidoglycan binding domain
MSDDRQVRGSWVDVGHRRLRAYVLLAAVAALLAAALTSVARGASGGAGVGSSGAGTPAPTVTHVGAGNPFSGRGMWIWELSSSNGGDLGSIIARAQLNGITTLMIKSGDGTGTWSQFNPTLVSTLHHAGLRVCAWQYVYGVHPVLEAQVGAAAVADGADCLLIDAESEYEGKYAPAQRYVTTLRGLIGNRFPVALAGFPYVDYHPAFPYSVFLGTGGAQYNVPQMYWHDIGTSVDRVFSHTYAYNRIYQRAIFPLGQIYNAPPARDIRRFRQLSRSYSAAGVSWWDWQEGTGGAWHATSQPIASLSDFTPDPSLVTLGLKAKGDPVVWAQEHLVSAGQQVSIDGGFGPKTQSAVLQFQAAHGLSATGVIDAATWQALLRYRPVAVIWTRRGAKVATGARVGGAYVLPTPASASLPAKRNELAGAGGRGRGRPHR